MKFTKKSDYALRLMEALARNVGNSPLSVLEISRRLDMSWKFLQGVSSELGKKKLIRAKSGPKGGLVLSRPVDKIRILEIVEAVEGKIQIMDCLDHPEDCSVSNGCSILSILHSAQNSLVFELNRWTLGDMVKSFSPRSRNTAKGAKRVLDPHHCPVLK